MFIHGHASLITSSLSWLPETGFFRNLSGLVLSWICRLCLSGLFGWQMFSRIKPKHKSPIESLRRIAYASCAECLPHIRDWSDDSIMNMCWRRSCIAGLSKSTDQFSRQNKVHESTINGIEMEVFMNPPFRSQYKYTFASLAWHILSIYHQASCLGHYRSTHFAEDIYTSMRMTILPSRPRPIPECVVIVICRTAARHDLALWNKKSCNKHESNHINCNLNCFSHNLIFIDKTPDSCCNTLSHGGKALCA